jgi:hypothetical protein
MKRIYLDQMHWINLAAARRGRKKGARYQDVLSVVEAGVDHLFCSVPLSDAHYMETAHRREWRSRSELAETMAVLSRMHTIAPRSALVPSEIDRALQRVFGVPEVIRPEQVFGVGASHAFHMGPMTYRVPDDMPVEGVLRYELEQFGTQYKEWGALCGVPPELEDRVPGLDLKGHLAMGQEMAERNESLRQARRSDNWHRGERSERLSRATAFSDNDEPMAEAIVRAGLSWDDVTALGRDGMSALVEDMPVIFVTSELHRLREGAVQQAWTMNDLIDIDALSRAVVHCDVVVTERQWATLMRRAGLDVRYGTVVLNDLTDLPTYIV